MAAEQRNGSGPDADTLFSADTNILLRYARWDALGEIGVGRFWSK